MWPYNMKEETTKVEPIREWMDDALEQVAPKEIPIGAALVRFQPPTEDPWADQVKRHLIASGHPPEDAFQHPCEIEVPQVIDGDLTSVPDMPPKGTPEEHLALHTFLNVASAAERLGGDNVTLPHHYARFNIEPIRFICENNLNFFQANIVKYILRWDAKNGLEDLRKAKRYLEMFIRFVQKDPDWWKA